MPSSNKVNKRVLVTGGCGFLGSQLCDQLLARPDLELLVCVDNLWTGRKENVAHIRDARFKSVLCEVEDFRSETRFDEVFHLASPASPPWYMREPARTISANIVGAMRTLELLEDGGRFCYTSTSEVYGEPEVSPQPESYRGAVDCTGPRSSYDEAKRVTESLLFETRRTRGLDLRVARLFNTFGPRMRPDDGRAISNFIVQALMGGPIRVQGDGSQSRSWSYVSDVIEGMSRYFWRDAIAYDGPLNIGNDREVAVLDVARYVAELVGGREIVFEAPMPHDPTHRCPDLTRARQVLTGWTCKVPYEEGVRLTVEWMRDELANSVAAGGAATASGGAR
jgi:UDP-glucose 4-epimerase/UDP-glucuronate decarboxylase